MNLVYCIKHDKKLNQRDIDLIGKELIFETVAKEICNFYNITFDLLRSKTRHRDYVEPRQVFCYIIKSRDYASLSDIAKFLRPDKPLNHATVLHGKKTISNLIENNKIIRNIVNKIEERL